MQVARRAIGLYLFPVLALADIAFALAICPVAMAQNSNNAYYNYLPPEVRQFLSNTQRNRPNSRGLPPTTLDSFVYQAGGMADQIYGDEGSTGLPPIDGFNKQNRINSGIFGQRDQGITTGHGSFMPDAWGNGWEWGRSGSNGGNMMPIYPPTTIDPTQVGLQALQGTGLTGGSTNQTVLPAPNGTSITYMSNPPAFMSNFGQWATEQVPYAVTEGMVPIKNNQTGQLMGWLAPGESLRSFLSGQTGKLLPREAAAAQALLNGGFSAQQLDYVQQ